MVTIRASRAALAPGLLPVPDGDRRRHSRSSCSRTRRTPPGTRHAAAGWSPAINTTLLRAQLGFRGRHDDGLARRDRRVARAHRQPLAERAATAGTDLILLTGSEATSRQAFAALLADAESGKLPLTALRGLLRTGSSRSRPRPEPDAVDRPARSRAAVATTASVPWPRWTIGRCCRGWDAEPATSAAALGRAGGAGPEPTAPGTFGLRILNVSEVARAIREAVRADPRLADVWVEGEVGRVTVSSAGHAYFTLKDARSTLNCVWFSDDRARSVFQPQAGLRIVVHGRVDLFEQQGAVQLYVESIQPAGFGDLAIRFEALKARLDAEGLFDPGPQATAARSARRRSR